MTKPTLSLVFVNYRSAALLERSLQSLVEPLRDITHEIIVINNDAKEEETLFRLSKQHTFTLKTLPENSGFGRANNAGAKMAQGKFLVFLNPDTEFHSGSFQDLSKVLEENPTAIFGFRLFAPEGKSEPWTFGQFPTLRRLLWTKFFPEQQRLEEKNNISVDWVGGAAFALSEYTFENIGGFDEDFFLYYEDVDLCLRAREKGSLVYWYPPLTFTHHGGQSHASYLSMKEAYFVGQRLYFEKHGTVMQNILLAVIQPLYRLLIRLR